MKSTTTSAALEAQRRVKGVFEEGARLFNMGKTVKGIERLQSEGFIGAAAAYRAGGHIAVTMLTDAVPAPARRALQWLADAAMLAVCGFVAWYGTRLCLDTMGQTIAELPWLPVGVTYLAIPVGAVLTLLFVIERIVAGPQTGRSIVRFGDAG